MPKILGGIQPLGAVDPSTKEEVAAMAFMNRLVWIRRNSNSSNSSNSRNHLLLFGCSRSFLIGIHKQGLIFRINREENFGCSRSILLSSHVYMLVTSASSSFPLCPSLKLFFSPLFSRHIEELPCVRIAEEPLTFGSVTVLEQIGKVILAYMLLGLGSVLRATPAPWAVLRKGIQ
jgi:hypothetical protein